MSNQPGFPRQVLTDTRVEVYQFTVWDQIAGAKVPSKRWGTLAGIEGVGGEAHLQTKVLVPKTVLGREHHGLSDIDFVPDTSW